MVERLTYHYIPQMNFFVLDTIVQYDPYPRGPGLG